MLLIKVTAIRPGHREQVTKGQHMHQMLMGPCDACFMASFHFQLNGNGKTTIRDGLGYFLVKVKSKSGLGQVKKGQISKLIFLHIKVFFRCR